VYTTFRLIRAIGDACCCLLCAEVCWSLATHAAVAAALLCRDVLLCIAVGAVVAAWTHGVHFVACKPLFVLLSVSCVFGSSPAEPYSTVADGVRLHYM
jgi:hypothetical protein